MNLYNLEEQLVKQNPQWTTYLTKEAGVKRDIFSLFTKELLSNKLILTLNGPRRSGKTYLMKQSMSHLVSKHSTPAQNICYFQFSGSLNVKNIIENIIDLYLKKYAKNGKKYIFLDEVQYIDYWQDQVKSIYDAYPDIKFVVSGSTSLFYNQKSKESLAGRIYKLKLGALSFHEYLRFKEIEEPSENRAKFISNLPIYKTEFKKYLSIGQYPEIVSNPEIDPKKYIADLTDQIINFDIPYFSSNIDRALFLNTVKTLSFDLAEEFSANNLAKILDADRREVNKYIKILQELSLFSPCYNLNLKSMRKKLIGVKKIYSLNLNLSLHINGFDTSYLNDSRVYGRYLENYVYIRLLEKYGQVEYYRSSSKEIDFVTQRDAFEIKTNEIENINKYQDISTTLKRKLSVITEESVYLL